MTVTPRSASSVSKRVDCFVLNVRQAEAFCSILSSYANYTQYLECPSGQRDGHRYRAPIRLCRMPPKGQNLVRPAFGPITNQALPMRDLRERGMHQTNSNQNASFVVLHSRHQCFAQRTAALGRKLSCCSRNKKPQHCSHLGSQAAEKVYRRTCTAHAACRTTL